MLPEKYAVRATLEILKYFDDNCINTTYAQKSHIGIYMHFPNYYDHDGFRSGEHLDSSIRKGYTEITEQQFLEEVLKLQTSYEIF